MLRPVLRPVLSAVLKGIYGGGAVQRYFIDLLPQNNSYYELATPIVISNVGQSSLKVNFYTNDLSVGNQILFGNTGTGVPIAFIEGNGRISFRDNDNNITQTNTGIVSSQKLHEAEFIINDSTVSIYLDGVFQISGTFAGIDIDMLGTRAGLSLMFDGIIANASFNNAGTTTTFKLDQATANTENSVEGNNAVTYQNIAVGQRELYTQDENGNWEGVEIVTNGGFDTDTDWTKGTGWSIGAGVASASSAPTFSNIQQVLSRGAGIYIFRYEASNYVGGSFRLTANDGAVPSTTRSSNGAFSEVLNITSDIFNVRLAAQSLTTCDFDNVSAKRFLEVA